ncbi:hypothetical protein K466DRAFT_603591 [Polyporus arcularius HHB13444]|uniref:DUF6533 domain-containing protein n=1 Tax=Polyporus arcularius HHB13444 TaxID=1314778 RepID=A0A5C3P2L6_9APHY|nr:hypothetical protein K466DRAFT_603591 [Polyporus arcularius HHB13444]
MSSTAAPDVSVIVSEVYHMNVDYCFSISTCAFFIYEFIITFDREVELFWKGRATGASILFLFNRYLPLITQLLYLAEYTTATISAEHMEVGIARLTSANYHSCALFVKADGVIVLAQYFPWAFIIISRTCLITADIILVVVTWTTLPRRTVDLSFKGRTFAGVLLRDGIAYFLVLLTMNVLHMAFSLGSILSNADISEITVFTEPVTAVLVSRFLIDLQEANRKAVDQTSLVNPSSTLSANDTLHFANFANSFGASIAVPGVEEETRPEWAEAEASTPEDTVVSSEVDGSYQ